MALFYRLYYKIYSELGLEIGEESIMRFANSAGHAYICDVEYFEEEGKKAELIGYAVLDSSKI